MERIRLLTLLGFILALVTSCDKYSDYQMIIDNKSSDTIRFYFEGGTAYTNGTDSIIVLPVSENFYYNEIGTMIKTKNHDCDPQISDNEFSIITSSSRLLIKNISNKENWNCETNNKNTYWKMIFTINETDLE
jgi:hypothetical protein